MRKLEGIGIIVNILKQEFYFHMGHLEALDKEYPLARYMEELSLKFDAEAFFREIMNEWREG